MRYTIHKINEKWWICLDGSGMFVDGIYHPMMLGQHELLMNFPWFDGEGSYVMDDELDTIPPDSKLREVAEHYPDDNVKVKFKDSILEKIQKNYNDLLDSFYESGDYYSDEN